MWTSHPWFNNNGVEGRSHSRSHIYRLPANRDGNSTTSDGTISSKYLSHVRPTEATRMTEYVPHTEPLQATAGNDFGGGAFCSTAGRTRERRCERHKKTQDAVALVESSSEDEPFEYGIIGAAADDPTAAPQDFVASASRRDDTCGRVQVGEAGSVGAMSESAAASPKGEGILAASRRDRRATYEEMTLGENSDVAPAELLEIVPGVVEAVRRCVCLVRGSKAGHGRR